MRFDPIQWLIDFFTDDPKKEHATTIEQLKEAFRNDDIDKQRECIWLLMYWERGSRGYSPEMLIRDYRFSDQDMIDITGIPDANKAEAKIKEIAHFMLTDIEGWYASRRYSNSMCNLENDRI